MVACKVKPAPKSRARRIAFAAAVLCSLLVAVLTIPAAGAHAVNTASRPRTWYTAVGVTTNTHAIEGMVYLPGAITVDAGDSIVWKAGTYTYFYDLIGELRSGVSKGFVRR